MLGLRTVWFQVGGTICNLRCHHCFISCSPENDTFKFMSLEMCRPHLTDAVRLGATEFYFTGGEPFANPEMGDILELSLQYGTSTVLTNATLFSNRLIDRLEALRKTAPHPLELRVSLDGHSPEMNDPIRGDGTFARAMAGVARLVERGFEPIITITRTWSGCDQTALAGFRQVLADVGYESPRLKFLPLLRLGAEVQRTGAYCAQARVTHDMMADCDPRELLCSQTRLVTDRGVWVCPILPDSNAARMGDSLADTLRPYPLRHAACHTCYSFGAICSNSTGCDQ